MKALLRTLPKRSVLVVLGTRPEIIKLAHVIRLLGPAASIFHTGQHYDVEMSKTHFKAFDLPEPDGLLGVGGSTRGAQIGRAIDALEAHLRASPASVVVVQGDTNSALAGAIAANVRQTPLVHVEAGLRSFDRRMPEEHNRVLADHLADSLCAPTEVSRSNLLAEGIDDARIVVTGNTIVEAVQLLLPEPDARAELLRRFDVKSGDFVLTTFHRPENVDDPEVLRGILMALNELPVPVVFPMHPRTEHSIAGAGLEHLTDALNVVEPLGYPEFLGLAAESAFLISDSGGIQEEASILKRPMLVVRRSTERPEVIGSFAEMVAAGPAIAEVAHSWLADIDERHAHLAQIASPYGDGSASAQTVTAIAGLVEPS
jgi:UDP-N-acetylglucosamine 2-epimerase (non-hydrolysing)